MMALSPGTQSHHLIAGHSAKPSQRSPKSIITIYHFTNSGDKEVAAHLQADLKMCTAQEHQAGMVRKNACTKINILHFTCLHFPVLWYTRQTTGYCSFSQRS